MAEVHQRKVVYFDRDRGELAVEVTKVPQPQHVRSNDQTTTKQVAAKPQESTP
jgi:hypothetical protein